MTGYNTCPIHGQIHPCQACFTQATGAVPPVNWDPETWRLNESRDFGQVFLLTRRVAVLEQQVVELIDCCGRLAEFVGYDDAANR